MNSNIPQHIREYLEKHFGHIGNTNSIYSYNGGVFDVSIHHGNSYVLKIIRNPDIYKIKHLEAEIAFAQYVAANIQEFETLEFVQNEEGTIIHSLNEDYFYLTKKHQIVKKSTLAQSDQQTLGSLMHIFHDKLSSFKHDGIHDSSWMREIESDEEQILKTHFKTSEYEAYIQPLDYDKLNLRRTLIHGDWHGDNYSFTNPPFLFDLDTLCYGNPSEEIARSITHWYSGVPMKEFHDNLIAGYEDLHDHEIALIPRLAIAICLKQFGEITKTGNVKYAEHFRKLIEEIKETLHT